MASQVLPQALHMIPINQVQSFNPLFARMEFVVRAESNPEGEAEANENDVEEAETKAAAEEEVQERKEKMLKGNPRNQAILWGNLILNKRAIEASEKERSIPALKTGDIVEIKLEVPENRRRLSVYKGIVISK
ncbi:hypothetical protein CRYUN_Cryun19dG0148200 [Craigia yunnanensis]